MALIRWEPVRELSSLQTDMNRLFNTFFDAPGEGGNGQAQRWVPAMDLVETDEHFVLRADLPGLSEEDISIEVEDNVLTVSGKRETAQDGQRAGFYRVERPFGSFRRSLTLPEGVEPETVQAGFGKGVLEIRIPKPEERKPRRVAIRVGGQEAIEGSEAASE